MNYTAQENLIEELSSVFGDGPRPNTLPMNATDPVGYADNYARCIVWAGLEADMKRFDIIMLGFVVAFHMLRSYSKVAKLKKAADGWSRDGVSFKITEKDLAYIDSEVDNEV